MTDYLGNFPGSGPDYPLYVAAAAAAEDPTVKRKSGWASPGAQPTYPVYAVLTNALADAPADGNVYGRKNSGWVNVQTGDDTLYVNVTGDTMTGPLVLPVGSDAAPSLSFGSGNGLSFNSTTFPGLHVNAATGTASSITAIGDGASGGVNAVRYQTSSAGPAMALRKFRGSSASPTIVATSDNLGTFVFSGYDGSASRTVVSLTATMTEPVPSTSAMGGRLVFNVAKNGTVSATETLAISGDNGLTWGGSTNIIIDSNRITRLRTYTVATLPSASIAAGQRAAVSDALAPTWGATVVGGGAIYTPVYSDGTNWKVG